MIPGACRFFFAVALCSTAAVAEERVGVGLRYSAAATCPSEVDFVAEVNARVRRPIDWNLAGAAIDMRVSMVPGDAGEAKGTLDVIQPGAEPTRREFTASTCAEVGSALALVAALTLDPNARTEALPARFPTLEADLPTAPAPPPPVEPPPPPTPKPSPPRAPASPARPAPPTPYSAWIGPTGGVASGYAPEPLVTLGVSLGVRALRRGWSPGMQLTPLWGETGTTGPAADLATFSWAMGRLEGCPLLLPLVSKLTFEPCLAFELGRLSARGADAAIDVPTTAERWWASYGATLSLQWTGQRWFGRAGALLLIPATRDELVFASPERLVHQPGAALGGTVAVGFRFGT